MSLTDWRRNSWVSDHTTSRQEIAALLAIVDRDIANAEAGGLSADWRLAIAYNAALQAATAALAASGYRAAREQHHFRTIQSLAHTLGWTAAQVSRFDRFRKKRNIGGYEAAGLVSEQEAREMRELALALRRELVAWLATRHASLLQP